MPKNMNEIYSAVLWTLIILLYAAVLLRIAYKVIKDKYAPVKSEKAQVVDKFVSDKFTKIFSSYAKKPQYYVVFAVGNRKRSFRVSEFSYKGYKVNEQGTLTYKGSKLIDFHK